MKTLLLLRHAKSSWKDSSLPDFERPLNDRGRKAAELVGKFIARQNVTIDLVISSPAVRARQTIDLVLRAARRSPELRFDQRVYEASPTRLLEITSQIEDDRKSVLLVGHNPGMEELLALLVGAEQHMPTASLAKVLLSSKKWDKILAEKGVLESFVKAKELKPLEVGRR
ncbi:MAG: histidine phosphatase family protein [Acidobacteria bacterium]|nr:histidine phosphatase family protein [Acidobacteriota bacterium]